MTAPTFRPPDSDLDRALKDDLGEFGAIYRRLPRPEPPKRLDRAVLAAAAHAVHGRSQPRAQRWLLGVGSAAGVLLAAGIAWRVSQENHFGQPTVPQSTRYVATDEVVPVKPIGGTGSAVQETTGLAKGRDLPATEPGGANEIVRDKLDAARAVSGRLSSPLAKPNRPAPATPAASKPAPVPPVEVGTAQATHAQTLNNHAADQPAPASDERDRPGSYGASEQEGSGMSSLQQVETPRARAPSAAKAAPMIDRKREDATANPAPPTPSRVAPAVPATAASAPALPKAFPEQASQPASATSDDQSQEGAMAAAEPETAEPASAAEDSQTAIASQVRRNSQLAPDAWLAEIIRLHRAGRSERAIANMRAFRIKYPHLQLPRDFPDDLRRIGE